jgi:hypothetical protein
MKPLNLSAHAYTQQQLTASRLMPRAGQRQL